MTTTERAELAAAAHRVETQLGWQSGVQDQHGAAWGGINLLEMRAYPEMTRRALVISSAVLAGLARRLITVYVGHPHSSSTVHEAVIARLEGSAAGVPVGPGAASAKIGRAHV